MSGSPRVVADVVAADDDGAALKKSIVLNDAGEQVTLPALFDPMMFRARIRKHNNLLYIQSRFLCSNSSPSVGDMIKSNK